MAESLIDELADLGDGTDEEPTKEVNGDDDEMEDGESSSEDEGEKVEVTPLEDMLKYSSVRQVAKLLRTDRLQSLLKRIDATLQPGYTNDFKGPVEENPEYPLIVDSNKLSVEVDNEVSLIHKFIRDHYAKKFPELEQMILSPLDYARVVKAIGNEMDLTVVDLSTILPSSTIMMVTVTASTTNGRPLPDDQLASVLEACDEALALDAAKKKILAFIESRMNVIAPNLSTLLGSTIAAQLIGIAGGLTALSKMPSCNVQLLGKNRKVLSGFSSATAIRHVGFIYNCELVTNTPPAYRKKACRLMADKCTLAARVDSYNEEPSGMVGQRFRAEVMKRVAKLQEPPPPKLPKPLAAPDDRPKARRGGKKVRKMKQKYQMTEIRKQTNRMAFGVAEEEIGDTGKGLGMLGTNTGSGKVRIKVESKLKQNKKQKTGPSTSNSRYGTISGFSTSLAFTQTQGLELQNPLLQAAQAKKDQDKYFSSTLGFFKVQSEKS